MAFSLGKANIKLFESDREPDVRVAGPRLASQARNAPSCNKNHDPGGEYTWIRSERARRKKIDKQQPHTDELSEPAGVEKCAPHHNHSRFVAFDPFEPS
jgi:hypothetical protein